MRKTVVHHSSEYQTFLFQSSTLFRNVSNFVLYMTKQLPIGLVTFSFLSCAFLLNFKQAKAASNFMLHFPKVVISN